MKAQASLSIWHDYVCPFCYIEATRIARINESQGLGFDVHFYPWPLEKANGAQPKSSDEDKWVQLLRAIEPGAFSGWNPTSGFWPLSSRMLFNAYESARSQDIRSAARFDLLLRQAIFQMPRSLDTVGDLRAIAGEADLDLPAFTAMLADGSADVLRQSAETEADRRPVRGIPTVILPDGTVLRNPGVKIRVTQGVPSIENQYERLRDVLIRAGGAEAERTRQV
jgi:predicted DsbA family dithiol-disulfide isomerase